MVVWFPLLFRGSVSPEGFWLGPTENLDLDTYSYIFNVTIIPDHGRRLRHIVMTSAKTSEPLLQGTPAAYDGKNSLYTASPLPFTQGETASTIHIVLEGRKYKVVMKTLHTVEPQEAMDTVLGEMFASKSDIVSIGSCFYSRLRTMFGNPQRRAYRLEELWHGVNQCIKPTEMGPSLIIDTSSKAFFTPQTVDKYVYSLLNRKAPLVGYLSDAERLEVEKALMGIKIEVTHRPKFRRKYCISGLTPQATELLTFRVNETNEAISVENYFLQAYACKIEDPCLPCLLVGNQGRPIYLPMQVCKIVEGQRYTNRLNESGLLDHIRVNPSEFVRKIVKHGQSVRKCARDFGITFPPSPAKVGARVLPAPKVLYYCVLVIRMIIKVMQWSCFCQLKYKENTTEPYGGIWDMMGNKMVEGGNVKSWICVNFVQDVANNDALKFCSSLAQTCISFGMSFSLEPVMPVSKALPNKATVCLKSIFHDAKRHLSGEQLDLVIFILPDNNGPLYGDVKRICETNVGVVSQCFLRKRVVEPIVEKKKYYFANVSLKINVKVGGRNAIFADHVPYLKDKYTIIFGADVTHPGDNSNPSSSPSIAAVVASRDWAKATKYLGSVRAQVFRHELIEDLRGMIIDLLESLPNKKDHMRVRIIFYRGGVSESQIYQVLSHELVAISQACEFLGIEPSVTYVVVNKRHHTRLTSNHFSARNVDPGTVVDSQICNQREFDFYLCSHAGNSNVTSRPAHYRVLHDDNKFEADGIQLLSNYLCYMNVRCTRAVSIVAPAHYARLLAQRGGHYIDQQIPVGDRGVRPLAALKDNIKTVMFYC